MTALLTGGTSRRVALGAESFRFGIHHRLDDQQLLDIMSNMKSATIRQVQHGLAEVITEVQKGQEIAITKHGKVVARLVPARQTMTSVGWPDSQARMNALTSGKPIKGPAPSEIVRQQRGERL
jgi:prevent-host-death family protein